MTADPRAVEIIREALEDSSSQDDEGAMWLTDREYPDAANRIARWLTDAGWSLLPPGGQTRTERGYWNPDAREVQSWWSYADSGYKAPDRVRTVTTWPDGSRHYGPWQPSDTPGEPA